VFRFDPGLPGGSQVLVPFERDGLLHVAILLLGGGFTPGRIIGSPQRRQHEAGGHESGEQSRIHEKSSRLMVSKVRANVS
jgi:hypothetical protein